MIKIKDFTLSSKTLGEHTDPRAYTLPSHEHSVL